MLLPFSKVQQLAFLREGLEPTLLGEEKEKNFSTTNSEQKKKE